MEEREEGEISEGEFSDISSEEEFLLRQRLQVLESYNHVLERKEARRRISVSQDVTNEKKQKNKKSRDLHNVILPDLSDISGSDLENSISLNIPVVKGSISKNKSPTKAKKRHKNSKEKRSKNKYGRLINTGHKKDSAKKGKLQLNSEKSKKHSEQKYVLESSDETDDEYRNKRRKLQHSVETNKQKTDQTSLKMRLLNMFTDKTNEIAERPQIVISDINEKHIDPECMIIEDSEGKEECIEGSKISDSSLLSSDALIGYCSDQKVHDVKSDDSSIIITGEKNFGDENSSIIIEKPNDSSKLSEEPCSEDDIEILRQNALQTKSQKISINVIEHVSDSDDSEELRMICLRSKVLRNKMEWRRKIKLRKKLARMSSIDDILEDKLLDLSDDNVEEKICDNTDTESVDMDIGLSDGPDNHENLFQNENVNVKSDVHSKNVEEFIQNHKEVNEEIEEDEDLLRAKLLTSLSNNLQKLYKTDNAQSEQNVIQNEVNIDPVELKTVIPETPKFIINIGESDSGSENETTANLKKMHQKLMENAENADFQCQLDILLKNARKETEITTSSVNSLLPKPTEKFVPKTVNHLPKSGQMEYKRLVKRMAELEKIKQHRQATLNRTSKNNKKNETSAKEEQAVLQASKTIQNDVNLLNKNEIDLESQIALSRKRIAVESAKVLRLKEESVKLTQKYKMVQTELRNIRTAMSLNKREVSSVQNSLVQMRNQHQLLLKRSDVGKRNTFTNTKRYDNSYKMTEPKKNNIQNCKSSETFVKSSPKSLTVNTANNLKKANTNLHSNISVNLNVNTNKKVVSKIKGTIQPLSIHSGKENPNAIAAEVDKNAEFASKEDKIKENNSLNENVELEKKSNAVITNNINQIGNEFDDYVSPLTSIKDKIKWHGDPNGILCPFDVSGACKDQDCQYQHLQRR